MIVGLTTDAKDTAPDTSWVLKRDRDDKVIVGCSLDSDQCQSPAGAFTGGDVSTFFSTQVTVNPNECYTATIYDCYGQGLIGKGSWAVSLNGAKTDGNSTFGASESISVGTCSN